jgi:hypothetical protein
MARGGQRELPRREVEQRLAVAAAQLQLEQRD